MSRGSLTRGMSGGPASTAAIEAAIAPARTTWAAAGGAAPTFTTLDTFGAFGGAIQPALGGSPTQDSSFNQIGKECFASCRILWGTAPTVGAGYYALTGLPVAPKITTGHGRVIGGGFIFDASTNLQLGVDVVLDPAFSTTLPMIFMHASLNTATDPDELGPASAVTGSWFHASNMPVVPAVGDILNVRLQYEGV